MDKPTSESLGECPQPHAHLDDPNRIEELRGLIRRKAFLRSFYEQVYSRYSECLSRCPSEGIAVELGSGAGFVKERIPQMMTSDTLPYAGVDRVVDATQMPFADRSLRALCMLNVFHHIPDSEKFFAEALRCLVPGGRILIVDQHVGWLSRLILARLHHEPFRPEASEWRFDSSGPLSGANGALAWIVFKRDRARFEQQYPGFRLEYYRPHSPFSYWVSGGLKSWSLLPGWAFPVFSRIEAIAAAISPGSCSFVDVELVKR